MLAPIMINPWLKWKVWGLFLLGRDFIFKWEVIQTQEVLQYLQILELEPQDNPKPKQKCVFTKS